MAFQLLGISRWLSDENIWPGDGQEAAYNGHKRQHSFKFRNLIVPSGMIAHFWGPFEGRRHDSAMYFFSGLDEQYQRFMIVMEISCAVTVIVHMLQEITC